MSEFECSCGELILPSIGRCKECGGSPMYMDGYSAKQWRMMENDADNYPEAEIDNEDEEDEEDE